MLFFMEILQLFCVIGATENNTFNAKRHARDRGDATDIVLIKE